MHHGSQGTSCRSRRNGAGLLDALSVSALLSHRLVEPCFDVPLPILVEMAIGDNVVSLSGHLSCLTGKKKAGKGDLEQFKRYKNKKDLLYFQPSTLVVDMEKETAKQPFCWGMSLYCAARHLDCLALRSETFALFAFLFSREKFSSRTF